MSNFTNKVAVITGAAAGIGKALAIKCLELSMKVVLADIDKAPLESCEVELKQINPSVISVVTDVAKESDIIRLANQTIDKFGAIHFLFNNAGIAGSLDPIWDQSIQDIEKVLQINLMGTIYGIKNFVPIMIAQDDECFIINTSAGAGFLTGPGLMMYKTSKHAITALSEVLQADLKVLNSKINVSVLIPHWVDTDFPKSIITLQQDIIDNHLSQLKNFGISPTEVADKVFQAIHEKQFYIFTHLDEHMPKIKKRMENILNLGVPI